MKVCTKCGEGKLLSEFSFRRESKDGCQRHCKECSSRASMEYRANNKERERERGREYRANNKEKIKKRLQKWWINNKEKARDVNGKWRINNKERLMEKNLKLKQKYRNELTDTYVKNTISKRSRLRNCDIPQYLISLKRATIIAKRKLKEVIQDESNNQRAGLMPVVLSSHRRMRRNVVGDLLTNSSLG